MGKSAKRDDKKKTNTRTSNKGNQNQNKESKSKKKGFMGKIKETLDDI